MWLPGAAHNPHDVIRWPSKGPSEFCFWRDWNEGTSGKGCEVRRQKRLFLPKSSGQRFRRKYSLQKRDRNLTRMTSRYKAIDQVRTGLPTQSTRSAFHRAPLNITRHPPAITSSALTHSLTQRHHPKEKLKGQLTPHKSPPAAAPPSRHQHNNPTAQHKSSSNP